MPAWPGAVLWSSSRAIKRPSSRWPLLRLSLRAVNAMWPGFHWIAGVDSNMEYILKCSNEFKIMKLGRCLDLRCVGTHDYQSKVWLLPVSPNQLCDGCIRMPGRLSNPWVVEVESIQLGNTHAPPQHRQQCLGLVSHPLGRRTGQHLIVTPSR